MAALLTIAPLGSNAAETNRYSNPQVGLTIEKPSTWHYLSVQSIVENRQRVRFKDEELADLVRARARQPLVVIAKYEDPAAQSNITPTVQITLSPLGSLKGAPAEKVMENVVSPMQRGFADFQFVKPVHATTVAGLKAAHTVATYTLGNQEGKTFEVRARLWIVPRGDFAFIVGMSGPQRGPDVSEKEFQAILQSIAIER